MEMKDIKRQIEKGKIVSLYVDEDLTTTFTVGKYLYISDEHILYNEITTDGQDNGLACLPLEEIYRVSLDGKYEKAIESLYEQTNEYDDLTVNSNLVSSLLSYAKNKDYIVNIELLGSNNTDEMGFVQDITDDIVTIKSIDDYGKENGISFFNINDISYLACKTSATNKIHNLYKINN